MEYGFWSISYLLSPEIIVMDRTDLLYVSETTTPRATNLRLISMLALPFLLSIFALDIFDESSQTLCIFCRLTSYECYGCGMGRAIVALLRGNIAAALSYNRLVLVVAPLFVCEYFTLLRSHYRVWSVKITFGS